MSEQRTEQRGQRLGPAGNGNGNGERAGRAKVEYVDPMVLKNDRELDEWWPLESIEEPSERAFIADIAERGVLCPLMVSSDGRTVWDGRRRLRAGEAGRANAAAGNRKPAFFRPAGEGGRVRLSG